MDGKQQPQQGRWLNRILQLLGLLVLLLQALVAHATAPYHQPPPPSVRLLIALPPAEDTLSQLLEQSFRKYFAQVEPSQQATVAYAGLPLQVTQHADQYELWDALHQPTLALFWLSHGSPPAASGGLHPGAVWDSQHRDLSNVFQAVPPKLPFLAVLTCFSHATLSPLFDRFLAPVDSSVPPPPPQTRYLLSHSVPAALALETALQRFHQHWRQTAAVSRPPFPPPTQPHSQLYPKIPLRLTRVLEGCSKPSGSCPAVRVENNGKILAVLPAGREPSTTQVFEIMIDPWERDNPTAADLIITQGALHHAHRRTHDETTRTLPPPQPLGRFQIQTLSKEFTWSQAFLGQHALLFVLSAAGDR